MKLWFVSITSWTWPGGAVPLAVLGQQELPGWKGPWSSFWSSSEMTECKNLSSLKGTLLLHERRNWMEMEKLSERQRKEKQRE